LVKDGKVKYSTAESTAVNQACQSITHPVLLYIPVEKDPLAPMHAPHGLVEHFLKNVRDEIKDLESESKFAKELAQVEKEVKKVSSADTVAHAGTNDKIKEYAKTIKKLHKKILDEYRKPVPNAQLISSLRADLKKTSEEQDEHMDESGAGKRNQLIAGAKFLATKIKSATKSESRIPMGKAEAVLDRAMPLFGQLSYRMEYGGRKLSHADGLKVLDIWDKIVDIVSSVYDPDNLEPGTEPEPEIAQRLRSLMVASKMLARPILALAKRLKSQDGIDINRDDNLTPELDRIKNLLTDVHIMFKRVFPFQATFPKLHHLEYHIIFFILLYGMFGRLSEEGMEAFHPRLNKIGHQLKSMMNTEQ
jgi:hypothetical protein